MFYFQGVGFSKLENEEGGTAVGRRHDEERYLQALPDIATSPWCVIA